MRVVTAPTWHRFRDTDDGDDLCTRCRVAVTTEAHMTFTHPCPVPACPSTKNPDDGCVMVVRRDGPCWCLYCHRSGDRDHETDPEPDEDLAAEMVVDSAGDLIATFGQIAVGSVLEFALLTD